MILMWQILCDDRKLSCDNFYVTIAGNTFHEWCARLNSSIYNHCCMINIISITDYQNLWDMYILWYFELYISSTHTLDCDLISVTVISEHVPFDTLPNIKYIYHVLIKKQHKDSSCKLAVSDISLFLFSRLIFTATYATTDTYNKQYYTYQNQIYISTDISNNGSRIRIWQNGIKWTHLYPWY